MALIFQGLQCGKQPKIQSKEMNKLLLISLSLVLSAGSYAQKAIYASRTVMSDSVNSSQDESAAVMSSDGKTLYFVRSFYSGNVGGVNGM